MIASKVLWYTKKRNPSLDLKCLDREFDISVMPRIADGILECSVYLYESVDAANQNESAGGTGFLVYFPSENMKEHAFIYAVTNKHIINDSFPVVRINTIYNKAEPINLSKNDWITHPIDDIAICALPIDFLKHKFRALDINNFMTDSFIKECDIGIGDDVFMVGRFSSHNGTDRNLPSVRFGNISMMPLEPHKGQDIYLVDMRSITGYSGSPVFAYILLHDAPMRPKLLPSTLKSLSPRLLGVDRGHISDVEPLKDVYGVDDSAGWHIQYNSGISVVVPVEKLKELLHSPKAIDERNKEEKKAKRNIKKAKLLPKHVIVTD